MGFVDRLRKPRVAKTLGLGAACVLAIFGLAQLVPYGRAHADPASGAQPRWDSPATQALAFQACFSCHSNLTRWPWYSSVAPASWLVQRDVDHGRARLNFTEWNQAQPDIQRVIERIARGSMPPLQYRLLHPQARLNQAQRLQLIAGLERTYASDPPPIRFAPPAGR